MTDEDREKASIVVLSIVTTIPIPSLVRFIIYRRKLRFEATEEEAYNLPDAADKEDTVF